MKKIEIVKAEFMVDVTDIYSKSSNSWHKDRGRTIRKPVKAQGHVREGKISFSGIQHGQLEWSGAGFLTEEAKTSCLEALKSEYELLDKFLSEK